MPASLYPRVNIPTPSDPRTGEARVPLRVAGIPGFSPVDDVTITSAQASSAVSVMFAAGGAVPDAPGGMLPFRLTHASGSVHLRIAFISDPTGTLPASVPPDLRVALVPGHLIPLPPAPAGSVMLNGSAVPALQDMLLVGDTISLKNVPGGYAQIKGGALVGTVLPLTLSFIGMVPPAAINATWHLVLRSAGDVWVTFAVSEGAGDTASVTELPWIHIPSTSASVDLGGPFTPGVPTPNAGTVSNVRNFGPGNLVVMNSAANDGADEVQVVAATIAAAGSGSIGLGFTAADGLSTLAVDVASNDVAGLVGDYHNRRISVSATTESIGVADTVLVLDASGSMLLRPDGMGNGNPASPSPAARRRWDNLVTAVNHLVDGYISFLSDAASTTSRLGIAVFPDVLDKATPGWPGRAAQLVASGPVTAAALRTTIHDALVNAGAAVEGAGLTPMGEGIKVAMGADAAPGMFHSDVVQHRRWMVLMTDGAHNAGTIHPNAFYQADAVPDFDDKAVRLFSIGYTTAVGGTAVDLLQDLADNALDPVSSGGNASRFAQAQTTTGFEKDLTDTFLDAMATTIGLQPTYDPPGILTSASPVAIHEVNVSRFDTGVGIFVDWQTLSRDRIHVTLISPRCERFDQATLEKHADFAFRGLDGYAHAYISSRALQGDASGDRYGTWRLELRLLSEPVIEIRARNVAIAVDAEPYKFNVFNRSGLQLEVVATRSRWSTGEPVELVARLRAHGAPVTGARVVGTVDAPTADYGTLLANAVVAPAVLEKVQGLLRQTTPEHLGLWVQKARAVAEQYGALEVSQVRRELEFHETAPGVYRAEIVPTALSGAYSMHVVATGQADEMPYRRERALAVNVEARPDPDRSLVTYELANDGGLMVRVYPRDRFHNAVIFDPSLSPRLRIEVSNAKPMSDVLNEFDGSYSRSFGRPTNEDPEVIVTYDGHEVTPRQPLPNPRGLEWMEQVEAFEPGKCRDHAGATDPKQALGPVTKPDDPFVALGAGGCITLAARHPIRTTHIVVFTHRDSSRSSRVFVRPVRERCWVPLGTAIGPIQVFEVPWRLGPIRSVMVQNPRESPTECVLLQGIGYARRRPKPHDGR